ncbi:SDR family NAD(P)-dependent oxidoreductase [Nocardia sp. NPDC052566]|uniref:SDR family NAD(P)-dependent oxidoreductase n=1 Tax=Nocardia sp. NPDC052566 TaxID=3364330 RepID=UPI0037C8DEAF
MEIEGSVAVVTGGASGLGLAVVDNLYRAGAIVAVLDSCGPALGQAVTEIGDRVHFLSADVTDEQSVRAALDQAAALGPLRIVVNCAGIGVVRLTLDDSGPFPLDQFEQVVRVNLTGTFNVVRLAAQRMAGLPSEAGERGVVVNTGSIAAPDGPAGMAAYVASKAGVAAMTLTIARDLAATQIRVVTIEPGSFDTPLFASLPAAAKESVVAQVPHPARLGYPSEFAALVAHVVENPMLNGEVIRLDGAARLGMGAR